MKTLSIIIILVALTGLLAFTNPKLESYGQYIISQSRQHSIDDYPLRREINALLAEPAKNMVMQETIRQD